METLDYAFRVTSIFFFVYCVSVLSLSLSLADFDVTRVGEFEKKKEMSSQRENNDATHSENP